MYNGENYLKDALDSLLAQTFEDFELIISDNGSTDGTAEIGRAYAAGEPRIRYYRNERNLGAAWNFNRVVELADGEYFKWAAHDDICGPTFLEQCVKVLDWDASVVLCYPKAQVIDERGEFVADYDVKLRTDSAKPRERFYEIVRGDCGHRCYEIFGLIRTSSLRTTPLMGNFAHGDGALLAQLALRGRFHQVNERLFFPRTHARQSMQAMADRYAYTAWFDPAKAGRVVLPYWRVFAEYFKSAKSASLRGTERMWCCLYLLRALISYRRRLLRELGVAAKQIAGPRREGGSGG